MQADFPDHNRQRKAAAINDYSSFGRCSLAVASPILAAMRIQCCPVPTAVFTNHTGFPAFSCRDLTAQLERYIADWQAISLRFDAIATGFLASRGQVDFVKRFIAAFPSPLVLVDPVMGDYGKLYPTYSPAVADAMHELLPLADVLTPNLTEACILASRPYSPSLARDENALASLAAELCAPHARAVVISGIPRGEHEFINFIHERGKPPAILPVQRVGSDRSGTGDVFSSVILGCLMRGRELAEAVRTAAAFVLRAIRRSAEMGIPLTDGLAFEEVLGDLVC
ncbi:MAG: bifunctional hydroxymethylpyrimidine kinase/phosphomethylpyrimidine kinase [Kiritimatiellae bacterium]|nr:bifunctional hydroxymethylpyrimidine kinase/phosphomethylpyrimidine kinase [Kiritimatiellia bacterium]